MNGKLVKFPGKSLPEKVEKESLRLLKENYKDLPDTLLNEILKEAKAVYVEFPLMMTGKIKFHPFKDGENPSPELLSRVGAHIRRLADEYTLSVIEMRTQLVKARIELLLLHRLE